VAIPFTHHALIQVAAQAELRPNDDTPIHLSLSHTCALNGINPFDYPMAREQNADRVAKAPSDWLPWNYRQTPMAARPLPPAHALGAGAKPPETQQRFPVEVPSQVWQDGVALNDRKTNSPSPA